MLIRDKGNNNRCENCMKLNVKIELVVYQMNDA